MKEMGSPVRPVEDEILNRAQFDAVFGSWSSFHDARLAAVRFTAEGDDAPSAELDLDLPTAYERQSDGSMRPVGVHRVTLQLRRAAQLRVTDFLDANWVGELKLGHVDPALHAGRSIRVSVEAIAGAGCELDLVCDAIAVVAITPQDQPPAA
jgi:hypothetical protein